MTQTSRTFTQTVRRFFEPIFREPGYFWRELAISLFYPWYGVANIFIIKEITTALETWEVDMVSKYVAIYGAFSAIFFATNFFVRHWWWAETYYHHEKMIHRTYMKQFIDLDNTYIENIGTGRAISIIGKWTDTWTGLAIDTVSTIARLFISITAAFIILLELGSLYIAAFFMLFLIVHVGVYFLNAYALRWRKLRGDTMVEYDKQLTKMIMSKFEILQNDKADREVRVLDAYVDDAKRYNLKLNNYLYAMFSMPNLVFFVITFSILISISRFQISFSVLISVFMILGVLKENMVESIDFFKNFTKQFYSVEKMWQLFDDAPKITGLTDWDDFIFRGGSIELKCLSFAYKDAPVFSDFSLSLVGGKKTALVGLSGSGKSTLVKLIAGYLHPTGWSVIVDGQNLAEVKLRDYYGHIGYLTQEPSVFDGTILENLTYGARFEVSDADLRRAIELAQCEFVYEFADGLQTEIGEKGIRLSGGQRQRLAIAKIFIKNPEIIILDEPTSALDSFSEEKINRAFHNLFQGRTVIVIAHRLQTVKEADDIIVLEHGEVVERGTHTELVERWGVYNKMLELQSGF